ncbi:MAG: aminodeoxychorismate/anthranilate synthase component II [Bacteroidales bacterium]
MQRLLIIDNYDSFTYNLVEAFRQLGYNEFTLRFNDQVDLEEINDYDKILLSPGPDVPSKAGLMPKIIDKYITRKSFLGVCLGHQAIAEHFGAEIVPAKEILHGVATKAYKLLKDDVLYKKTPQEFDVGRYHSWVVDANTLPDCLLPTLKDSEEVIMGFSHKDLPVYGVQYHPESIMTPFGRQILLNWLESDTL